MWEVTSVESFVVSAHAHTYTHSTSFHTYIHTYTHTTLNTGGSEDALGQPTNFPTKEIRSSHHILWPGIHTSITTHTYMHTYMSITIGHAHILCV